MIKIWLSQSEFTLIDDIDADLAQYTWHAMKNRLTYYAKRALCANGKVNTIYLHRVIMERVVGRKLLSSELVDHKDDNGLNNTRNNLNITNHQGNKSRRVSKHICKAN